MISFSVVSGANSHCSTPEGWKSHPRVRKCEVNAEACLEVSHICTLSCTSLVYLRPKALGIDLGDDLRSAQYVDKACVFQVQSDLQ